MTRWSGARVSVRRSPTCSRRTWPPALIGGLVARIDLALPFLVFGALELLVALLFFRFVMTLPNPEDVDNGDRPQGAGLTDPQVQQ